MKYSLRSLMIVAVVAIFALVLYVLSIGPVTGLQVRGILYGQKLEMAGQFYWPITWARRAFPPVEDAVGWYISFFRP